MICFRNLEHQNYAIHFNRSPMICWHFTGIIITTSKGERSNNAKHFLVHHLSGAISQIYTSTYTLAKETEYCNLLRTYGWFEGEITTICKTSHLWMSGDLNPKRWFLIVEVLMKSHENMLVPTWWQGCSLWPVSPQKIPKNPLSWCSKVGWSAGLSVQEDNFMKFNGIYDLWPELKTVS